MKHNIIALFLCAAFIFTACSSVKNGEMNASKGWFDNIRKKFILNMS